MYDINVLIREVEKRPALYDPTCRDSYKERLRLWSEIGEIMFKNWHQYTQYQKNVMLSTLNKKWKAVRDNYRKYIRRIYDPNEKISKKYIYHDQMRFLKKFVKGDNYKNFKTMKIHNDPYFVSENVDTDEDMPIEIQDVDKRSIKKETEHEEEDHIYDSDNESMPEMLKLPSTSDIYISTGPDLEGCPDWTEENLSDSDTQSTSQINKKPVDYVKLIMEVEKRPDLYNPKSPGYIKRDIRNTLWEDIAKEMFENFEESSGNDQIFMIKTLKAKWKAVRDCYKKKFNVNQLEKYRYHRRLKFLRKIFELENVETSDAKDNVQSEEVEFIGCDFDISEESLLTIENVDISKELKEQTDLDLPNGNLQNLKECNFKEKSNHFQNSNKSNEIIIDCNTSGTQTLYICDESEFEKIDKTKAYKALAKPNYCRHCNRTIDVQKLVSQSQKIIYSKYDGMNNATFLLSILPQLNKTSPEQSKFIQQKVMDLIQVLRPLNSQS